MGYLSKCNAETAIATCDPYNWRDDHHHHRTRHGQRHPIKIRHFDYSEVASATNNFSSSQFLGKGSHASVFKAVFDQQRLVAAVKLPSVINPNNNVNCTGRTKAAAAAAATTTTAAADNEIEILSRVNHPRIVNLIGFCSDPDYPNRRLLVVEYMPGGSLFELLHGPTKIDPPGWTSRVRFALQVARAVHMLHASDPPIIHRDIKSSNVLIDGDRSARLGDFGLSLRGHVEDVRVRSTPPAGTLGYLDPGYLSPGDLSTKSDVFSFGILLLEMLSGRQAIDVNFSPPSIVDWAVPLIKRGDYDAICDGRVRSGRPDTDVIRSLAVLAARCVRSAAEKRPGMREVVEVLKAVTKRMQAARRVWGSLRRRVGRVEERKPCSDDWSGVIGGGEAVESQKFIRVGTRRSNRKVYSSVSSAENRRCETVGFGGDRVIRSKSIGSFSEIKLGTDFSRRKSVAVKVPAVVKFSKSRSMGVLRGSGVGSLTELEPKDHNASNQEIISPVELDEKSEKEMQEKPLVTSLSHFTTCPCVNSLS